MNQRIRFLFFLIVINGIDIFSSSFMMVEKGAILERQGDCDMRHAPCSTFKIAMSLMGYDQNILIDESLPVFSFQEGYIDTFDSWKHNHNPTLWIKNSCIWYSWKITERLGIDQLQEYVMKFNYGNQDLSGDRFQNNGLTHAWLSSSLEISVGEQIYFLQKLVNNELPVTMHAQQMTKKILFIQELENGWKLYGKTGNGFFLNEDRTERLKIRMGWFVGWIERGDRAIIFAQYIQDTVDLDSFASLRAKAAVMLLLQSIITLL